jgi:catechol 2,3-dioxygenase-like lactoylglutathione lyase family enzyme
MAAARYLVDDLDAAVRFYTGRLGFGEGWSFGPVTLVQRGDLELWLSAPGSSGREQDGAAPGGWNRIVLDVPDLDEAVEGLAMRGSRVDGPAGSWCVVEDPWGNPIELFQAT